MKCSPLKSYKPGWYSVSRHKQHGLSIFDTGYFPNCIMFKQK